MQYIGKAKFFLVLLFLGLFGCSFDGNKVDDEGGGKSSKLKAGSASRSLLPTVDGKREYLASVPGWPAAKQLDPNDAGVIIPVWDQGKVAVGNGASDSAWVHDDVRATAVAIENEGDRVIMVSSDLYMHFRVDAEEVIRLARLGLSADWADVEILIAANHNHHGPDTLETVNFDWYAMAAQQMADAIIEATQNVEPASASVAAGRHDYGSSDQRDPIITDNRLNVLSLDTKNGEAIAVLVQWNSHPETTLNWTPTVEQVALDGLCATKDWDEDDCNAEGRYFTGDYPGVLQARLKASRGGEVLYFNGALGVQIGPGSAPTWVIDEAHPIGDGMTPPKDALPLTECDNEDLYLCRSFAKTESIGTELANAVTELLKKAEVLSVEEITIRDEPVFTRLTNIGFRLLLASNELGWNEPEIYKCEGKPFTEENCTDTQFMTIVDELFLKIDFNSGEILEGDVVKTRLVHVDLGEVGFLFMPGELPPELVIGLPDDFNTASTEKYYNDPDDHVVGEDYIIPGYMLSLVDEPITFTIGLGTDQLGYYVPVSDYRLTCDNFIFSFLDGLEDMSCEALAERDSIESPQWVGGLTCQSINDDPAALAALGDDGAAVMEVCRYGQMVGRELEHPSNHYEETNTAGWDLADDLWAAAERLFK